MFNEARKPAFLFLRETEPKEFILLLLLFSFKISSLCVFASFLSL